MADDFCILHLKSLSGIAGKSGKLQELSNMSYKIRNMYLIMIIPLIFLLRLYQIYMNMGVEPHVINALREPNFLWITAALTAYPVCDLAGRIIQELRSDRGRKAQIPWYYWFLLVSTAIADVQAVIVAEKGIVDPLNVRFFFAYQLIGLSAFYLGRYRKEEMRRMILVMAGIIAVTAVYGLIEWAAFFNNQTQLLLVDWSNRVESLYGNAILSSSSFLVGYWLTSLVENAYMKTTIKGIILLAIVTTLSRSTWIGLVFSLLVVCAVALSGKSAMWQIADKKRVAGAAAAIIIAMMIAVCVIPSAKEAITARFVNVSTSVSYLLRVEYWMFGLKHFIHEASLWEKIAGTGYNTSEKIIVASDIYQKWEEADLHHFDNVYVSVLTDFGLAGIVSLIIIVWKSFANFVAIQNNKDKAVACCSIAAIGLLPAVAFWDPIYCPINMILFIALVGVIMSYDT